jgi:hypothetical protein
MQARATTPCRIEARVLKRRSECRVSGAIAQPPAVLGDKQVIVCAADPVPADQIAFQSRLGGIVQRNQARLAEFRLANQQTIDSPILEAKVDGLGDTQTGTGKQGKQGAVRVRL